MKVETAFRKRGWQDGLAGRPPVAHGPREYHQGYENGKLARERGHSGRPASERSADGKRPAARFDR